MEEADPQLLTESLEESISCYRRIYELLVQMNAEIGTASPLRLQSMVESLKELDGHARKIDELFLIKLQGKSAQDDISRSLATRQQLVQAIIHLNTEIEKKARGTKSLLAHELETLRQGQNALCGYKTQGSNAGKIVNSTS